MEGTIFTRWHAKKHARPPRTGAQQGSTPRRQAGQHARTRRRGAREPAGSVPLDRDLGGRGRRVRRQAVSVELLPRGETAQVEGEDGDDDSGDVVGDVVPTEVERRRSEERREGKSVSVRVVLGGRRIITKKK